MASLISIRLYNTDGTPKVWASPLLSAILEKDWSVVLDWVSMIEKGNWWYDYKFDWYDKREIYYISIDWEPYDAINLLDSYGNKETRGRANSIIIDTQQLAKDIRGLKEKDMKNDTVGAYVFSLKSYNIEDFNTMIEKVQKNIDNNYESLILKTRDIVSNIKIPKELNISDIVKPIEKVITENSQSNILDMKNAVLYLEKIFNENIRSDLEWKFDKLDESIKTDIVSIQDKIEAVKSTIDNIAFDEIVTIIRNENEELEGKFDEQIESSNKTNEEIIRMMRILFTRLNSK